MMTDEKVILIVDDEPDMCWVLEHVLRTYGYASRRALSGNEALTLVEQYPFRSLFLDAKLPDIEGLELARRIREVKPDLRIVMVSGYFYRDDMAIQRSLNEGLIVGFIAKPFSRDEILKALEKGPSPEREPVP